MACFRKECNCHPPWGSGEWRKSLPNMLHGVCFFGSREGVTRRVVRDGLNCYWLFPLLRLLQTKYYSQSVYIRAAISSQILNHITTFSASSIQESITLPSLLYYITFFFQSLVYIHTAPVKQFHRSILSSSPRDPYLSLLLPYL